MFITVLHTIHDPAAFQERGVSLTETPPTGLQPHQFLPSTDLGQAICLWEAGALEDVRGFVDGTLGDSSSQSYFTVADEYALGLPNAASAA